jgi:uncharacterized protein (TIGR02145 family)
MKKILTIIMLCGVCYGYAQNAPPTAITNETWVIQCYGVSQVWSDRVRKLANDGSGTEMSFAYAGRNAQKLCPKPWRLPSANDFRNLLNCLDGEKSRNEYGSAMVFGDKDDTSLLRYVTWHDKLWMLKDDFTGEINLWSDNIEDGEPINLVCYWMKGVEGYPKGCVVCAVMPLLNAYVRRIMTEVRCVK